MNIAVNEGTVLRSCRVWHPFSDVTKTGIEICTASRSFLTILDPCIGQRNTARSG